MPCSVCSTSGWNWTPYRPRPGASAAATGVPGVRAVTAKPGGRGDAGVAVRHPDLLGAGQAAEQHAAGLLRVWLRGVAPAGSVRAPAWWRRTRRRRCAATVAAQARHHELEAVADAQHRHPRLEQARRGGRRARGVDRGRAAGQDDRRGAQRQHLRDAHRARHDLRVHLALADPARDELRVLGAEIHHEDRARPGPDSLAICRSHPQTKRPRMRQRGWPRCLDASV